MSLKVEDPNNPGQEIEVFTPDEVAAKDAELTAARAEATAAKAEAEKYQKVSAEKTENFKKLNDLTESEKASLSAEKIEAMKRFEAAEARAAALEATINEGTKTRAEADKATALASFHGGDPKLKEQLEKNYELINITGNDTASIQQRAKLAAEMYKGSVDRPNPLMAGFNGASPQAKEKSKTEEFMKSDKATAALKLMGDN